MSRRAPLAVLAVAVAAATVAACGTADGDSSSTVASTVPNVGNLPGPLAVYATTTTEPAPPTTEEDETEVTAEAEDPPDSDTIGELADGPRVLFLGDSVTQSIGEEYSGGVCDTLVPEGWQVAMDAETGRFIDHGLDVLDERLEEADWDAAVLNFGSNYRGDASDYGLTLRMMLNRLLPRPVLLVTVSEPEENRAEVNFVLREAARRYENVRLLEWSEETRLDGSLTAGDGLHLSAAGQELLAAEIGDALGEAPGGESGACLDIDDLEAGDTGGGDTGDDDGPTETSDGSSDDTTGGDTDTTSTGDADGTSGNGPDSTSDDTSDG